MFFISTVSIFLLFGYNFCNGYNQYILRGGSCKIPNMDPFNFEVNPLMKPEDYMSCSDLELLTYVTKTDKSATLHVKETLIERYSNFSKDIKCCYSNITRDGSPTYPDEGIKISPCEYFQKEVALRHDNVKVICMVNNNTIYENVHSPITIKESVKNTLNNDDQKPISVLLVVVDAVSRLNFIRTMRKTHRFLRRNKFVEMRGYNKIDDNTFPNFMALLTGFSGRQSWSICDPRKLNRLDECPMIWYDYRDLGYATAYAEDDTGISTFTWNKKGFTKPPTDYYFKPYMEGAETLRIVEKNGMPYCTGPETSGERILNLAKDFATTFLNHPSFGIFWMNTFSHNDINSPYGMDAKMKQFFMDIKEKRVLNESIVIVLSDHGIRAGDIRLTRSGWFEERLPINMISVPPRFREKFRNEYANLKKNSDKLTNTFDMYMTLQHILALSHDSYKIKPSPACPKCMSLFEKIPLNRSCEDASIPSEWCTCIGYLDAVDRDHNLVTEAIRLAIGKIKDLLDKDAAGKCEDYVLSRILNSSISENSVPCRYLFVTFETKPLATFMLTVKFNQTISNDSLFYITRFDITSKTYKESVCAPQNVRSVCKCQSKFLTENKSNDNIIK